MSTQVKTCIADTGIYADAANSNYGTMADMYFGWYSATYEQVLLTRFPLADAESGMAVDSAVISVYSRYGTPSFQPLRAYRIRRTDWIETQATWNNYKTGAPWSTAGAKSAVADIDTSVYVDIPCAAEGWAVANLAALYAAAVAAGDISLNICLRPAGGGTNALQHVPSREDASLKPFVTYTLAPASSGPALPVLIHNHLQSQGVV